MATTTTKKDEAPAPVPFLWGRGGERMTPEAIKRRRAVLESLLKGGADYSPVKHWTQGLARVAQGLVGGYESGLVDRAEDRNAREEEARLARILADLTGANSPAPGVTPTSLPAPGAAPAPAGAVPTPGGGTVPRGGTVPGGADVPGAVPIAPVDSAPVGPVMIPGSAPILPSDGFIKPVAPATPVAAAAVADAVEAPHVTAALDLVRAYESNGQNVPQGVVGPRGGYNPSTGTVTGPSSASGYYQMIDPTWRRGAALAGIDVSQWPRAMNAPEAVQRQVAAALYANGGFSHWAPYNAKLRGAIGREGGARTFTPAGYRPMGDNPAVPDEGPGVELPPRPPAPAAPIDSPAVPGTGPGVELPYRQPGTVSTPRVPSRPPVPIAGGAAEDAERVAREGGPRRVLSKEHPLISPADLPAAGANAINLADMPARGANPAAFFVPPTVSGGEPTIIPTAEDARPAAPATSAAPSSARTQIAQALSPDIVKSLGPYASDTEKMIAGFLVKKHMEEQARGEWVDKTLPDGTVYSQNTKTGQKVVLRQGSNPLEDEKRRIEIAKGRQELDAGKVPTIKTFKQADGSDVAMQWDAEAKTWKPLAIPRDPNAKPKLTEQQAKDATYYERGQKALEAFEKNADAFVSSTDRAADYFLPTPLANRVTDDRYQQARSSGLNFLAAVLRKDTGAGITKEEQDVYGKIFLPQPGEKPGSIALKKEARKQALEAIRLGLGPAEALVSGQRVLEGGEKPAEGGGQSKPAGPSIDDLVKKYGGGR